MIFKVNDDDKSAVVMLNGIYTMNKLLELISLANNSYSKEGYNKKNSPEEKYGCYSCQDYNVCYGCKKIILAAQKSIKIEVVRMILEDFEAKSKMLYHYNCWPYDKP